jgi:hypothetical protein
VAIGHPTSLGPCQSGTSELNEQGVGASLRCGWTHQQDTEDGKKES